MGIENSHYVVVVFGFIFSLSYLSSKKDIKKYHSDDDSFCCSQSYFLGIMVEFSVGSGKNIFIGPTCLFVWGKK